MFFFDLLGGVLDIAKAEYEDLLDLCRSLNRSENFEFD
jgi:hypothetical protein